VASRVSISRCTFSACRAFPHDIARRNDLSVDGARIPSNSLFMPPWRITSRSSIESAPTAIPATIEPIL
jgi:hypothetical protein